MEEDGDGEDLTPFWIQNTTNHRRVDRLRRGVSSLFFSSGLLVFLLLVTAVFFLVFVVPSTISFSVSIFRPSSVKKSWDSLNIFLVLVAVVFGFLSRNKNEERDNSHYDGFQSSSIKENESQKSNPSTPNKWYNNYSTNEEEKSNLSAGDQWFEYADYQQKNLILRRNSSSYPDLREFPSNHWYYGDYQRRVYDDIHVESSRGSDPVQLHHRRHRSLEQVDYLREPPQTKMVIVDTLVSKSKGDVNFKPTLAEGASPPLPPPPPAATAAEDEEILKRVTNESAVVRKERSSRRFNKELESLSPISAQKPPLPPEEESQPAPEFQENQKRSYQRVARKRERSSRKQNKDKEPLDPISAPPPQPPPPPPPPPPPQQKSSKIERKKDFLTSLYQKKKRKQRQKSVDNMDSLLHEAQPYLSFQIPPPSPPPPAPQQSVFQNLFSKKQKRKRTITVTLEPHPPPPPPPPPPPLAAARKPGPSSQTAPLKTHKPKRPIKMNSFDKLDETSNSGGESPMNRIPPPPPPPPPGFLKGPVWKFVVQGDYVRINSNNSSRSGSPEPDETESDVTPSATDGGAAGAFHPSPLFCPSPDVNTKAESFITNFRAKLKLEKIHSMKKRDLGLSSLGPGPGPSQI